MATRIRAANSSTKGRNEKNVTSAILRAAFSAPRGWHEEQFSVKFTVKDPVHLKVMNTSVGLSSTLWCLAFDKHTATATVILRPTAATASKASTDEERTNGDGAYEKNRI